MAEGQSKPPDDSALNTLRPGTPFTAAMTVKFKRPASEETFLSAADSLERAALRHGATSVVRQKRLMPADREHTVQYELREAWQSADAYRGYWGSEEFHRFRSTVHADLGTSAKLAFYQPSRPGPATGHARAPVPKTGQKQCWDEHYKSFLPKPGDPRGRGQDGYYQAGQDWPDPRFTDNGDGTVTDRLTNLVWLKDADYFGEQTWTEALQLAHKLHGGSRHCPKLNDHSTPGQWRLPNIRELLSLIDFGAEGHPILPCGHRFENYKSGKYWTSTSLVANAKIAWMMTLALGPTVFDIKHKSNKTRLWPVRDGDQPSRVQKTGQTGYWDEGGNPLPPDDPLAAGQDGKLQKGVAATGRRFTVDENGVGTVTDHLTGLVWLKKGNPFEFLTWHEALEECAKLADGDHGLKDGSAAGEWRLPNIREIESLVDYGKMGPCLPEGHPFSDPSDPLHSVQPSSYWTSTSVTSGPSQAMFIILGVGPAIFEYKGHRFFAWPVRNRRHR
ncbi:MAG TPA: DUF1566 domain-containing protein [Gemmataceae bacterium]|jgi:hypothetical protein